MRRHQSALARRLLQTLVATSLATFGLVGVAISPAMASTGPCQGESIVTCIEGITGPVTVQVCNQPGVNASACVAELEAAVADVEHVVVDVACSGLTALQCVGSFEQTILDELSVAEQALSSCESGSNSTCALALEEVHNAVNTATQCATGDNATCNEVIGIAKGVVGTGMALVTSCANGTNSTCNTVIGLAKEEAGALEQIAESCVGGSNATCNGAVALAVAVAGLAVQIVEGSPDSELQGLVTSTASVDMSGSSSSAIAFVDAVPYDDPNDTLSLPAGCTNCPKPKTCTVGGAWNASYDKPSFSNDVAEQGDTTSSTTCPSYVIASTNAFVQILHTCAGDSHSTQGSGSSTGSNPAYAYAAQTVPELSFDNYCGPGTEITWSFRLHWIFTQYSTRKSADECAQADATLGGSVSGGPAACS